VKRVWLILLAVLAALPALAHDPQLSSVTVRLLGRELRASVVAPAGKADGLGKRVRLRANGQPVTLEAGQPLIDTARGTALLELRGSLLETADMVTLETRLFPEESQSKTLAYLYEDGRLVTEARVDAAHPSATLSRLAPPVTPLQTVKQFIREGVGHIFLGFDHICFVVGLLLLGGTLKQLLKVVTGFTLAHSVTLCLAATGVWTPPGRFIEPLIALSIIAIGLDNLLSKPGERDIRAPLALGFGLIHGFGFAGALADVGLPKATLGLALGAFNIGVEAGQAVIVLLLAPVLAWVSTRWPEARRKVLIAGSVGVALLGAFWFAERILG
jgi:hydrogenase/urease accessory protein HupE